MNYCDKINYSIFSAEKNEFPLMVDQLLSQLPEDEAILRLAFFGMPTTNEQYLTRKQILKEKVSKTFSRNEPVLSYVSQPPLGTSLILEVHSFRLEKSDNIRHSQIENFPYVILENTYGRFLFAGGFQSDILNLSIEKQSREVFRVIGELLEKENFPINSIIRQWNYIERITDFEGENQNYQSFNNARGDFYGQVTWDKGYPAATGIGANLGGVLVDLDAAVFTSDKAFATPIDNKLQIAAHAYSEEVLIASQKRKATPKFERAKSITFDDNRCLVYISGTAAIRGEESLKGIGLEKQLHITMENIAQLTGDTASVMLRVYLKDKNDYAESARLMNEYNLNIPISYMCADVCRDELLIEIEGIALN